MREIYIYEKWKLVMNTSKEFSKWKMAWRQQEHVYLANTICYLWKRTKWNNQLIDASFVFINVFIMAKNLSILLFKIALSIEFRFCAYLIMVILSVCFHCLCKTIIFMSFPISKRFNITHFVKRLSSCEHNISFSSYFVYVKREAH